MTQCSVPSTFYALTPTHVYMVVRNNSSYPRTPLILTKPKPSSCVEVDELDLIVDPSLSKCLLQLQASPDAQAPGAAPTQVCTAGTTYGAVAECACDCCMLSCPCRRQPMWSLLLPCRQSRTVSQALRWSRLHHRPAIQRWYTGPCASSSVMPLSCAYLKAANAVSASPTLTGAWCQGIM